MRIKASIKGAYKYTTDYCKMRFANNTLEKQKESLVFTDVRDALKFDSNSARTFFGETERLFFLMLDRVRFQFYYSLGMD